MSDQETGIGKAHRPQLTIADIQFRPVGNPVDGYQVHGYATPEYNSYYVLPEGEDPNKEVPEGTGTPALLEFTSGMLDQESNRSVLMIQAEWAADTSLFDFASAADRYFDSSDGNLAAGDDGEVTVQVALHSDESSDPTVNQTYQRPFGSESMEGLLDEKSLSLADISSVAMQNRSGGVMWTPEDYVSAQVSPSSFIDLSLGIDSLVSVFDDTRNRETTPSPDAFQAGFTHAITSPIGELPTTTS